MLYVYGFRCRRRLTRVVLSNSRFMFRDIKSRSRNTHRRLEYFKVSAVRLTRNLGVRYTIHAPTNGNAYSVFPETWDFARSPVNFHWETQVRRPSERDRNDKANLSTIFRMTSSSRSRRKFTTTLVSSTVFSYWEHNLRMDTKRAEW